MKKAAVSILVIMCLSAILSSAFLLVATAMGWKIGTVVSGSMEPNMGTGQMAIAKPLNPDLIQIGDVIAFRSPDDPHSIITHRVIEIVEDENNVRFRTKGDANSGPDNFVVPAENLEGKIILHVPYLGYLVRFSQTSLGLITMSAVATSVLVIAWMLGVRGPELKITRRPNTEPKTAPQ